MTFFYFSEMTNHMVPLFGYVIRASHIGHKCLDVYGNFTTI